MSALLPFLLQCDMALLHTSSKPRKKQPKKPGWRYEQEQHEAWLAQHKPNPRLAAELKRASEQPLTLKGFATSPRQTQIAKSVQTAPVVEKTIHAPRVLYKDDPEMLARELKAKERKFTAAPLYNKGGDMLITEEAMKDIMAGATRRR